MFDYSSIFVTKKNKKLNQYLKLLVNATFLEPEDFVSYLFSVMPHDRPLLISVAYGDTIALSIVMDMKTMDIGAVHVFAGSSGPIQLASISIYSNTVYTEDMKLNLDVLHDIFSKGAVVKQDNVRFFCDFSWLDGMLLFDTEKIFTPIIDKVSLWFNASYKQIANIAFYILVSKNKDYAELIFKQCYAMKAGYDSELLSGERELDLESNHFSTIGFKGTWFNIVIENDEINVTLVKLVNNILFGAGHNITQIIEESEEYKKQTGVDIQVYKDKYNLDLKNTSTTIQWVSMNREYVVKCSAYDVLLYITTDNPMKQVQILIPTDKKATHLLFNKLHSTVFGLKEAFARKQYEFDNYVRELSNKLVDKILS